ncbi:MAG: potassium channel protein [Bacteroidetes bacterium]|nr:potassium channel protein [Bacteroidota bacterium]MCH8523770.1 NAD-binding protein [Balneolales bacterium]
MKFFASQLAFFVQNPKAKTNIGRLLKFGLVLLIIVIVYALIFHWLMIREGQEHSLLTSLYWTLTVMSTLGFGDITFTGDVGRLFSIIVLMSGIVFLLVLLPFTFIQFFYAPWLEAQNRSKAPTELDNEIKGHVLLTNYDPISSSLITKLENYGYQYYLIVNDLQQAVNFYDTGIKVLLGELDDPATFKKARLSEAAMLVATGNDMINTNVVFTAREICPSIPIASLAHHADSVDILKLAGSTSVIQLGVLMGQSLARRTLGGSARVHVIGRFDQLVIGEAPATGTPLVGKSIAESRLREIIGVNIIGVWERGVFEIAQPETKITDLSVLVLAGSVDQLRNYDEYFGIYNVKDGPVIIIGAGKVGRSTAKSLADRRMDFTVVEKDPAMAQLCTNTIVGDAADREVLTKAGIDNAHTVIITTHNDDVNIYLTLYCRRLRPDLHIISRSTLDRNVSTLHRAGADFVMSYSSMGSNAFFNVLERDEVLMIAEGLNVFRMEMPKIFCGKTIAECGIRKLTGCSIIAIQDGDDMIINPDPDIKLTAGTEVVLIGDYDSEKKFVDLLE